MFAAFASLLLPNAHAEAKANPGFSLELHDSFNDGIDSQWGDYSGEPGGNPYGWWDPKHVMPYKGHALLRGYREGSRFVTGGMMLNSVAQTYGSYVVRAKFDKSSSIEHCFLLWPVTGWPPEVDFSEGPTPDGIMATSHWSTNNTQEHAFTSVDMTRYHEYGVQWTPTKLSFTLDGKVWATMTGAAVPHQPMKLALQTAATRPYGAAPTAANPKEVRMSITDVWVYKYHS